MFNARTWHRLCLGVYLMFPAIVVTWVLPKGSPFHWLAWAVIGWGCFVAVIGAIQGVMLARGKLHFGCPVCDERSLVLRGDRDGMYLLCPHCGELRVKIGGLFGMKVIRPGSKEDDLAGYRFEPNGSPLLAPKRYPVAFAIIFLPVVVSIVAASVIREFTFFYLFIPGFWCYAIGSLILHSIFTGSISDSHGTALRSSTPVRFWCKVGIWSLFYLFAIAFPIGFALQGNDREKARAEQGGGGDSATLRASP